MTPEERELLERHKPVLMFDPQYDYRALDASSALANPGNLLLREHGEVVARGPVELDALTAYEQEPGDFLALVPDFPGDASRMEWEEPRRGCLYGRVEPDGGLTWLQYWFWLYYNPKHLFGFGKHEGDWEMVQIGLDESRQPRVACYAQHASGETRPWREGPMRFQEGNPRRPLVFVAPLSHASYFEPGTHPYFFGMDDPRADGPAADLPLAELGDWAEWKGKWGNPERAFLGRLGMGPSSPGRQGDKWTAPSSWHRRLRHRKLRVLLGKAAHALGSFTYPHEPAELRARRSGQRVTVEWKLARGARRGRHLYVTLHQDHLVLCSRRIRKVRPAGETSLRVPDGREPTSVKASVYNRLRQRSDPQAADVERWAV